MKTRDELIEAFALAYVTPDMLGRADPAVIMDVAFGEAERLADAFVAERERRAITVAAQTPVDVEADMAHDASRPAAPDCPKRAELRFVAGDHGRNRYLSQGGRILNAWDVDRFGAGIYPCKGEFLVETKVRATSPEHAESIAMAMLSIGRETK